MRLKFFALVSCCLSLVACEPSERMFPIPVGGGEIPPAQPAAPAQPAQQLPLTTAWAENQTRQSPSPSATPSVEPTAETDNPQAVPPDDDLKTIPGVREVHYASQILKCYQMKKKFQEQGLKLDLVDVVNLNQPGRSGKPRKKSKRVPGRRDISSSYGGMYICVFEGPDAVNDRYGWNDDYNNVGMEAPDYNIQRHPNDYRPDPNATVEPDRSNPNRRTVPDPDPNRPKAPDPYDDLPF